MITIFNSGGIEIDAEHERDDTDKMIANRFVACVLRDHAKIGTYPTGQIILRKLKLNLCMFDKKLVIGENLRVELVRAYRPAVYGKAGMTPSEIEALTTAAHAEQTAKAAAVHSGGNAAPFGTDGIVVTYDPLTTNGYGDVNPAWLVLAHELIHTLHYFEGGKTPGETRHADAMVANEELRTVGLGQFRNEAICENRLRAEANLTPRAKY